MKKIISRVILALVMAGFVAGAVVTPAVTVVFAAEETANQDQPTPPSNDVSQGDNNEHSGHHH